MGAINNGSDAKDKLIDIMCDTQYTMLST